jgi:hypothetical protein
MSISEKVLKLKKIYLNLNFMTLTSEPKNK